MEKYHSGFVSSLFVAFSILFFGQGTLISQSSYAGKPRYQIIAKQAGLPLGTIIVELFPNIAPRHAANFDSLVSTKFYDTTAFHRVIPGFMIQGGDPNSRHGPTSTWGMGQPTQTKVKAEFSAANHVRGILSAARSSNINSATSQFFICVATAAQLDGLYSVYGRVTSGMSVVDAIVNTPRNTSNDMPLQKVEMFVTYIGLNDTVPNPPVLTSPPTATVGIDTNYVALKWNKVSDGIFYRLDVARDSLFKDTVKSLDLAGLTYGLSFLSPGTKFYWKVKVNNGGFYKDSQIWNFTTAKTEPNTTQIKTILLPTENPMVFPNPGRDKFTFANVSPGDLIEITDLSGKLVHQQIAKDKMAAVELPYVAKGAYLYRITRNSKEVLRGKLVLQQ